MCKQNIFLNENNNFDAHVEPKEIFNEKFTYIKRVFCLFCSHLLLPELFKTKCEFSHRSILGIVFY